MPIVGLNALGVIEFFKESLGSRLRVGSNHTWTRDSIMIYYIMNNLRRKNLLLFMKRLSSNKKKSLFMRIEKEKAWPWMRAPFKLRFKMDSKLVPSFEKTMKVQV